MAAAEAVQTAEVPSLHCNHREEVDLTAYDPAYPVRARLVVPAQPDQSLLVAEMVVFTSLE